MHSFIYFSHYIDRYYLETQSLEMNSPFPVFLTYNHVQKYWDTFAFLGRFRVHTGPTPPLTQQTKLEACIQNFFRVLKENFKKGCTVL